MSEFHTGVYGDHSTDGWLEWGLDKHFAEKRAEREARGDFGASMQIDRASGVVERARNTRDLRRAKIILENAGLLAAQEARFQGYEINGWESDPHTDFDPPFERLSSGETRWFMDIPLRRLETLPEEFRAVGKLALNPWIEYLSSEK